jgi:hypothetical protein
MPLGALLDQSNATGEFKADALAYAQGQVAPRITIARHVPRIKVLRLVAQLLHQEPGLAIERMHVDAESGCSDLRGSVLVEVAPAEGEARRSVEASEGASASEGRHVFDFVWDCAWRASLEGWTDYFGYPDQRRAADEFGWRCFAQWTRRDGSDAAQAGEVDGDSVGAH